MVGFGMDQMLMSFRHQALSLDPQLVVVGFIDLDFDRSLNAYDLGKGFTRPALKIFEDGLILKTEKDNPNLLIKALERRTKVWMALATFSRFLAFHVPIGEWWNLNEAILDNIRAEALKHQVPVLFVRIPEKNFPEKNWLKFQTLSSYMKRVKANYLDLGNRKFPKPFDIHFVNDGHINAKGHRWVADKIIGWMKNDVDSPLYQNRDNKKLRNKKG